MNARRMGRFTALGVGAALMLAWPARASAGDPKAPAAPKDNAKAPENPLLARYSPYERATINGALKEFKGKLEPSPEGKIIEHIRVLRLPVIEERDPAPNFLNWFHVVSRGYTITRELLMREGQPFRQVLVDETARNLRKLNQVSLVLCIALQGSSPDRVKLLLITKDVWSLRLNNNFRFASGRLEFFFLQPSEENVFGTHHAIAANLYMDLFTYSFGGRYTIPRIGGSYIRFLTDGNIILNRQTGKYEGSYGTFSYGQPLYTTRTPWAWGTTIQWRNEMFRRFCPLGVGATSACAGDIRGFDAKSTPQDDAIPFAYRSDIIAAQYSVTRSFGWIQKNNVSAGLEINRRKFTTPDLSAFNPSAVREFEQSALPISDTRIAPYFEYKSFSNHFHKVLNFNTLGLQEDLQTGHEVILRLAPVTQFLNSTRNFLSTFAAAKYSLPLADGLASAFVESVADFESERIPDASLEIGGQVTSPSLGIGRLVVDGRLLYRYRNYLNRQTTLGGNARLRGYPSQAFLGKDIVLGNIEFRSRPVEILSCQLGGAVFFDTGDAFSGFGDMSLKQSVGFGVRVLFPQLDRTVLRVDWGFPVTPGYRDPDGLPGDIVITFRQAFLAPDVPSRGDVAPD